MNSVFVDTAALIAIGNKQDFFHHAANQKQQALVKAQTHFISSDFVIAEFCNAFSRVKLRATAVQMVNSIYQSKAWTVISINEDLMTKSLALFTQMQDKEWGLVDCSSIILARENQLDSIFTTDKHFEQAGFEILLKQY
ncbi:PilT-like protein [Crenothrix polyspora]|uniref:PilT-like protein n=1 Tax=Crenothrix polyspora TaxID=360316 RepID=A0A1R4H4I9_9GAMM|nr:PIN domain-containing protein [Crenothrix polyspora]SJM91162.1 PilT-like protein [Crenothrix polyspora]